jgi:hypothetical protein
MFDLQSVFSHPFVKKFNPFSVAVFDKLARCHTRKMGFHRLVCQDKSCGKEQFQYHNCGDRNCPNCGGLKRDQWIENRTQELLPTPYYHLVFTLPHELNSLILGNRKKLFNLLFESASGCILTHSNDPKYLGANCGITMVLHTWGQNLSFHPHVHCIVSGGGFDGEKWVEAKRKKNNFLFPETSLSNGFRDLFLKKLLLLELERHTIDVELLANNLQKIRWNVYAKAPFAGPKQVIDYLGRYTHKVAITRHRIVEVTDNEVVFNTKHNYNIVQISSKKT